MTTLRDFPPVPNSPPQPQPQQQKPFPPIPTITTTATSTPTSATTPPTDMTSTGTPEKNKESFRSLSLAVPPQTPPPTTATTTTSNTLPINNNSNYSSNSGNVSMTTIRTKQRIEKLLVTHKAKYRTLLRIDDVFIHTMHNNNRTSSQQQRQQQQQAGKQQKQPLSDKIAGCLFLLEKITSSPSSSHHHHHNNNNALLSSAKQPILHLLWVPYLLLVQYEDGQLVNHTRKNGRVVTRADYMPLMTHRSPISTPLSSSSVRHERKIPSIDFQPLSPFNNHQKSSSSSSSSYHHYRNSSNSSSGDSAIMMFHMIGDENNVLQLTDDSLLQQQQQEMQKLSVENPQNFAHQEQQQQQQQQQQHPLVHRAEQYALAIKLHHILNIKKHAPSAGYSYMIITQLMMMMSPATTTTTTTGSNSSHDENSGTVSVRTSTKSIEDGFEQVEQNHVCDDGSHGDGENGSSDDEQNFISHPPLYFHEGNVNDLIQLLSKRNLIAPVPNESNLFKVLLTPSFKSKSSSSRRNTPTPNTPTLANDDDDVDMISSDDSDSDDDGEENDINVLLSHHRLDESNSLLSSSLLLSSSASTHHTPNSPINAHNKQLEKSLTQQQFDSYFDRVCINNNNDSSSHDSSMMNNPSSSSASITIKDQNGGGSTRNRSGSSSSSGSNGWLVEWGAKVYNRIASQSSSSSSSSLSSSLSNSSSSSSSSKYKVPSNLPRTSASGTHLSVSHVHLPPPPSKSVVTTSTPTSTTSQKMGDSSMSSSGISASEALQEKQSQQHDAQNSIVKNKVDHNHFVDQSGHRTEDHSTSDAHGHGVDEDNEMMTQSVIHCDIKSVTDHDYLAKKIDEDDQSSAVVTLIHSTKTTPASSTTTPDDSQSRRDDIIGTNSKSISSRNAASHAATRDDADDDDGFEIIEEPIKKQTKNKVADKPVVIDTDESFALLASSLDAKYGETEKLTRKLWREALFDEHGTHLPDAKDKWQTICVHIYYGGVDESDEELRSEVWKYLLGYYSFDDDANCRTLDQRRELDRERSALYESVKAQWTSITPQQEKFFSLYRERRGRIDKDVVRTDRSVDIYIDQDSQYLTKLRSILLTYGMWNFDLGYCQGMGDLLSPILHVIRDEAQSFWCFVCLMESPKSLDTSFTFNENDLFEEERKRLEGNGSGDLRYLQCSGHFEMNSKYMEKQLNKLQQITKVLDSEWYAYLEKRDATNFYFCFRWLLVLLKREFSFNQIKSLWERVWSLGFNYRNRSSGSSSSSGRNDEETCAKYPPCAVNDYFLFMAYGILRRHKHEMMNAHKDWAFDDILKFCVNLSQTLHVDDVLKDGETVYAMRFF